MDFRNNQASHLRKRSGGGDQDPTRNTSPFAGQRPDTGYAGRSGGAGPSDSGFARGSYQSSFGERQRLASPQEPDSQARIE